jgi:hypothetical protein
MDLAPTKSLIIASINIVTKFKILLVKVRIFCITIHLHSSNNILCKIFNFKNTSINLKFFALGCMVREYH